MEAAFLPGRNLLLLVIASTFGCAIQTTPLALDQEISIGQAPSRPLPA
jgi:hypothetical protein